MKKSIIVILSVLALASCSHDSDLYQGPEKKTISEDEIRENAQKVFGVTFDPNHDWCSTISGKVTIKTDASVEKVQVLVKLRELYDCEWYVTQNTLKKLNEAKTNGRSTITLTYNAPKDNLGFYVTYYTKDGNFYAQKVEGNTVSFNDVAPARTRALSTGYNLPAGEFKIAKIEDSFASERANSTDATVKETWKGWENNLLYSLSDEDYGKLKMSKVVSIDYPEYTEATIDAIRDMVNTYFPNGRTANGKPINNLAQLANLGQENGKSDPLTTGYEPIIVTPIYKFDHPDKYGNEVYNSDLYYYYYDDEDADYINDPVGYLKNLPKYKAVPFNQCFVKDGDDDTIKKYGSFALLYYGDGVPEVNTKGTYQFPAGLNLGFMVRAKTTFESPLKQGEVSLDGRLNNQINGYGNFKSSGFKTNANTPRAAWLNIQGKAILCWESGTDADFNDILIEVEGGIDGPCPPPVFDDIIYTFCFEDTKVGDYDMNDVVIKAQRIDETTMEYRIVACGAYDAVYVRNLDTEINNKEVHSLFVPNPETTKFYINTDPKDKTYYEPKVYRKTVAEDFDLLKVPLKEQIYIYDGTTDQEIHLSQPGELPYAILIPYDMLYPKEKTGIDEAFPYFTEWGVNRDSYPYWYMTYYEDKVYRKPATE